MQHISRFVLHFCLIALSLLCIIPLVIVVSASLSDETALVRQGYALWPRSFSLEAYQFILNNPSQILSAYKVSLLVTVVGTIASLLITSLMAYPISRREFRLKSPIAFYVFFTMLFNGGLVPTYIVVTQTLQLKDSLLALILPYLIIPFNVLLVRTFFSQLPEEIIESAKVDGLNDYGILFRIVLPLSKPVLATVGLMCSLGYWNDWWLALLYINDRELFPLQFLLQNIMSNIQVMATIPGLSTANIPSETARMAMGVLAIGPIIFVYLFFQKYFVRGLTVGAIKG